MKFSRDNICEMHNTHTVEAGTPEEAAKIFKEEMRAAFEKNMKDNSMPKYIDKKDINYIPEIWTKELTFFSEDLKEYDSTGKEIPFTMHNLTKEGFEKEKMEAEESFVWGVKSADDFSGKEPGPYTMNDLEIDYIDGKYQLSIEEIYYFQEEEYQITYLKELADKLKEFVISQGYTKEDTESLYEGLSDYYPSNIVKSVTEWSSPTLIDLYRKFRLFVIGYEAIARAARNDII